MGAKAVAGTIVVACYAFGNCSAAELRVLNADAFAPTAFRRIAAEFERETGNEVVTLGRAGLQTSADIDRVLRRGGAADVVIVAEPVMDGLVADGKILQESRVYIARSAIGVVVQAGRPHGNIGTADGLRRVLLAAGHIACSGGASGAYVVDTLFDRLGVATAMNGRVRRIQGRPVAAAVAQGEADIGFGPVGDLLDVRGTDYLGPLPESLQQSIILTAGISSDAPARHTAQLFLDFLTSPAAGPIVASRGLAPLRNAGDASVLH